MMLSNTFFLTCIKSMLWQVWRSFQYGRYLKKNWLLLERYVSRSWSFLSLLSLYYSLSKYNFNIHHHFKYKFSSILFQGTIFLDSVVKMAFHLAILMFSWQEPPVSHVHQFSGWWKVHWCSSIYTNRACVTLPFSLPWYCKALGSIMDANKYDCIQHEILLLILVPRMHPFILEFCHNFHEWF
jgi:hypothetical protein